MAASLIAGGAIPSRTGVTLMARLVSQSGQLLTRASVSAIGWRVSNLATGVALGSGSFATTTIYDSLQTQDGRWSVDDAANPGSDGRYGYNFLATLEGGLFATTTLTAAGVLTGTAKGQVVQADVRFTATSGEEFTVVWRWQSLPVYG